MEGDWKRSFVEPDSSHSETVSISRSALSCSVEPRRLAFSALRAEAESNPIGAKWFLCRLGHVKDHLCFRRLFGRLRSLGELLQYLGEFTLHVTSCRIGRQRPGMQQVRRLFFGRDQVRHPTCQTLGIQPVRFGNPIDHTSIIIGKLIGGDRVGGHGR